MKGQETVEVEDLNKIMKMNQGKSELFESELSEEQERKKPLISNFNAVKKSLKVASEVQQKRKTSF